tara:strand:- start:1290 stop:1814 length:525 start_codon:yes stop_codon:yes gene_type:complete
MNKYNQYITPDHSISIDIELKSVIKQIEVLNFIKKYKISNIWKGKFFIKKLINKIFKYQLYTPMKWAPNFWDSITVELRETTIFPKEIKIQSELEKKTTKKRFKDIKKYQKMLTQIDMGEPLYITSKALNMLGANIKDDKIFILDGSRRLVANILNKTNPNIIIVDLKKDITNE